MTTKCKNTKPELAIRSLLWSKGYRFKIHDKKLPGKPDIVLLKHKIIINIQGCFWHNHGCYLSSIPKTNTNYWLQVLDKTKQRDFNNTIKLRGLGWRVIDIWECTLKKSKISQTFQKLEQLIIRLNLAA